MEGQLLWELNYTLMEEVEIDGIEYQWPKQPKGKFPVTINWPSNKDSSSDIYNNNLDPKASFLIIRVLRSRVINHWIYKTTSSTSHTWIQGNKQISTTKVVSKADFSIARCVLHLKSEFKVPVLSRPQKHPTCLPLLFFLSVKETKRRLPRRSDYARLGSLQPYIQFFWKIWNVIAEFIT